MPVDCLSVKKVSFRYNSVEVLSDISFSAVCGDYIGLVGPNGSGKTTLIKTILNLAKPSGGEVTLFGKNPAILNEWHRVGYLPQRIASLNPFFPATVDEIVALGLISRRSGRTSAEINGYRRYKREPYRRPFRGSTAKSPPS